MSGLGVRREGGTNGYLGRFKAEMRDLHSDSRTPSENKSTCIPIFILDHHIYSHNC